MTTCNEPEHLFTELLPPCYFHPSAVCPSTFSIRVFLMTLMERVVSASLPHASPASILSLHLGSVSPSLCRILHLPISPNSFLKSICQHETPQGNNNRLETKCGGTGCLSQSRRKSCSQLVLFELWIYLGKKETVSFSNQRTSTEVPSRILLWSGCKFRRPAFFLSFC